MGEQHKKHSRREHLNDFHLNIAGEYVYDGDSMPAKAMMQSSADLSAPCGEWQPF